MKRVILIIVAAAVLGLLYKVVISAQVSKAAVPVGYLDMQKALFSHPKSKDAKEALQKFFEERQKDIDSKFGNTKNLSDEEKQLAQSLMTKYEQEIAEKDKELTEKLVADIQASMKKIAEQKKLTVILDKQVVLWGGVDITEDIVKDIAATIK